MPTTANCLLHAQQAANQLGSNNECHATATAVYRALKANFSSQPSESGENSLKELIRNWDLSQNAIYKIKLGLSQDALKWGHDLVVQQIGTEFVIYQSFTRCYSLDEWLNGGGQHRPTHDYNPLAAQGQRDSDFQDWKVAFAKFCKSGEPTGAASRVLFGGNPVYDSMFRYEGQKVGVTLSWKKRASAHHAQSQNNAPPQHRKCVII